MFCKMSKRLLIMRKVWYFYSFTLINLKVMSMDLIHCIYFANLGSNVEGESSISNATHCAKIYP